MRPSRKLGRSEGLALVTVISLLSLMAVLTLSILTLATSERSVAQSGSSQQGAAQLRDLALNLVINQIRRGTSAVDGGGWASQPGAIRRFDADGRAGRAYKLYSSSSMSVADPDGLESDALGLLNWQEQGGRFVDLNQPVRGADDIHYPVIDPRAIWVEGFGFDAAAVAGGRPAAGVDDLGGRLPMPVEWIYVLRDGSLGTLDEGLRFVGAGVAGADNPIVGRVAFWADDESSKIHVNTASEPTHWAVPRTAARDEIDHARYQPAQNEFQRYPGHPATTALSPLFAAGGTLGVEDKERIYRLAPRVPNGGSRSGTAVTASNHGALDTRMGRMAFFASPEEMIFGEDRRPADFGLIDRDIARRVEAFVTAHGRSPELNLHGLPRVAIWPTNHDGAGSPRSYRTAFDQLISFCSTLGRGFGDAAPRYHFQRRNSDSSSEDYQMIARNRVLYDYLRELTSRPVPGFGGANFRQKYGADHPQILTQIFDYIRCVNLYDDNHPGAAPGSNDANHSTYTNRRSNAGSGVHHGHGQVVPIRIGDTRGFGRFNSVSEVGFAVICCADPEHPQSNDTANPMLGGTILNGNQLRIQMMLLIEAFSPAHGWTQLADHMRYRVSGLSSLRIDGQALYASDEVEDTFQNRFWGGFHSQRTWGGTNGFRNASFNNLVGQAVTIPKGSSMSFSGGELTLEIASMETSPPEIVQTIRLSFPATVLPQPKLVTQGTPAGAGASVSEPRLWWSFRGGYDGGRISRRGQSPRYPWNPSNNPDQAPREAFGPRPGGFIYSDQHDVVRTLLPAHGDYRLTSAMAVVPAGVFAPIEGYEDRTRMLAHNLHHNPAGSHWTPGYAAQDINRQLVPGANYHHGKLPDFPPGAQQTTGDFDNGIAFVQDGPYINKPDEGNNHRGHYLGRDGGVAAPYFDQNWVQAAGGTSYFSPNRLICSPASFGSLPTGVLRGLPWQTLLFRPQPGHPNAAGLPDHLWMDLFWMPVVDPWAISEPSSTAGKVNLNHQLMPFRYIERTTALRAVFRSTKVTAIPKTAGNYYKIYDHEMADYYVPPVPPRAASFSRDIDANETLRQFAQRFAEGQVFRTGSEVCEMHLVPVGASLEEMESGAFWAQHALTGDNTRERPYSYLHPRLTARSNSYRVHYRVQALGKARGVAADVFDPERDAVLAEQRGSVLIERYLRWDHPLLPDYGIDPDATPRPDELYEFRVLNERRFSP